ncbi:MAG: thiamine phosphate synthase [Rhodobiaceae bacterium]|nr:thiamine phosphate synthase [Rhodobiaceae bacterium]MCC0048285.1 thiamine phosphate synthase [Rhodobiaceae bacterium]
MTDNTSHNSEPRIVLFAQPAQAATVTDRLAGVAAIVITGDADALDEDLRNAIRNAGTPVLKASTQSERADGFDGLHLQAGAGEVKIARKVLAAGGMLGAGAARTRHAAMQLGEAMPDYVLLGRIATADPTDNDIAAEPELVEWWSDLFELPCVAVAETTGDVGVLAESGADFIGLNRMIWEAQDPAGALGEAAETLASIPPRLAEETGA